jgi:excisionase family DNA binding protein
MPGHPNDPLTVAETAKLMGRSTEQIRRYLREGVLPGRRLGGQWFVDRSDVDALLQQRRVGNDQWHWLMSSGRDPLRAVIALGGSGGGDIAAGMTRYLQSLTRDDSA